MQNHPKDRHVVAAAAAIEASVIVTSNIRDFASLPSGVTAMTPDDFLSGLLDASPAELVEVLVTQAAGYRRPTLTAIELIERLSASAPKFAEKALIVLKDERPGWGSR